MSAIDGPPEPTPAIRAILVIVFVLCIVLIVNQLIGG